jgi:hypothetical protein
VVSSKERRERRKHKRFQVPKGAFVGLGPYFGKVGPIIDVSRGGLAFRYIGSAESNGGSYLDMFLADKDFFLRQVQFKPMWDSKIVDEKPSSSVTMRRQGVRFKKLTHYQRSQLEYFIQNHTMGEA